MEDTQSQIEESRPSVFPTQAEAAQRYNAIFGTRARFVVLMLVLLCLTSVWGNILTFNFAVICMGPNENGTVAHNQDAYEFTSHEKSFAIAIVAVSAMAGNFPVLNLVNNYGIRTVFTAFGFLSGVATLLAPLSIRMGFHYFLAARFLQGLCFAANLPVIGAFCAKWAYFKQNGLFMSVLVAYLQLSPALTNPASGALCEAFRWPSIFYAHGAVSLILFASYAIFYRNSPAKHPFVGDVEKHKISIGKVVNVDKKALKKVPYSAILSTRAIWAVWIASIGNFAVVNMMFLFSPTYISTVLGFSVHNTGITAALPPLAQFLMKIFCGAFSDRIKIVSEVAKLRLFNSLAFVGSFIFLIILACMDVHAHPTVSMMLYGCAAGIIGANTGGFFKAAPILSRQYSHFVTGNISLGITFTMLVVPFVVNILTPNNTQEEWRIVFVVLGTFMLACNVIFCIWVRGEPCAWTEEGFVKPSAVTTEKPETVKQQKF